MVLGRARRWRIEPIYWSRLIDDCVRTRRPAANGRVQHTCVLVLSSQMPHIILYRTNSFSVSSLSILVMTSCRTSSTCSSFLDRQLSRVFPTSCCQLTWSPRSLRADGCDISLHLIQSRNHIHLTAQIPVRIPQLINFQRVFVEIPPLLLKLSSI